MAAAAVAPLTIVVAGLTAAGSAVVEAVVVWASSVGVPVVAAQLADVMARKPMSRGVTSERRVRSMKGPFKVEGETEGSDGAVLGCLVGIMAARDRLGVVGKR